jgi:hypothetical protein
MWLSFDLGVRGDYESLYAWLDNHDATECGNNVAFLKYELPHDSTDQLLRHVAKDLESSIEFGKSDRVYVACLSETGDLKGRFIVGKRKAAPWQGYGDAATEEDT